METECKVGRSLEVKTGHETDVILVEKEGAKTLYMRKFYVVEGHSDTELAYARSSALLLPSHYSLSSTILRHRLLEDADLGKAA